MGVNVEGATKMVVSQATGPNNGRVTFPSGTCSRSHVLWPIVLRVQQRQQKTRTHTRIQAAFQLFSMTSDGEFDVALVLAGYKLT